MFGKCLFDPASPPPIFSHELGSTRPRNGTPEAWPRAIWCTTPVMHAAAEPGSMQAYPRERIEDTGVMINTEGCP